MFAAGLTSGARAGRDLTSLLDHAGPPAGPLFNASQLAPALGGAAHATATRYLDTLVDTLTLRRLEPHLANVGKRLVKAPKIYVRDSGLLHALLGLASVRDLQGHPVAGASWEGFVVEQVAAHLPAGA